MNRKEKQAQTRAALLAAARRVFAERGLAATTIDHIAAEAGFTKGAFYANFASKEDLYLVLLDERFGAEIEHIEHALAGVDEPADEARQAAGEVMSYIWSDPAWPRLFLEFTIHASQDDVFRAKLAERYADLHDRVTELYRRWSARFPARPPIPMSAIATMTFCMANGFNVERIIRPGVDEEVYPAMLEVFFRGLVAMAVEHTEAQAGNAAPISSAASSP